MDSTNLISKTNNAPLWIGGFNSKAAIQCLLFAFHALSPSEAFSTNIYKYHRPFISSVQYNNPKYNILPPYRIFRHQKNSNNSLKIRSSTYTVHVATGWATGKSNPNGEDFVDEVPWQCVIDPHCCDECLQFMNLHETVGFFHKDEDRITTADKISLTILGLSGILAFSLLIALSGAGSWRFFLAGGLCAAASHAVPTPIDVVKTKLQVNSDLQGLSFIKATQKIIQNEGIGSLLAGLGPTICGYLLEGACKFGVYEVTKPVAKKVMGNLAALTSMDILRSQILCFIVSGCVAGTAASVVLAPMEALRIRLVSEPSFAPKGWVQGGRRMIRREGVLSMWKGILPQIYKQVPYTVTKNVSFDFFTKFAYRAALAYGFTMNQGTKFAVPFVSAIFASILSCVSSQPGDMLLSIVSARQGEYRSTNEIARDIIRSERGIRGFFVGLNGRLVHVGIIVTLQLVLYDFLKRLCGGIATGAH